MSKTEELQNWYSGFIDYFREEYEKLTSDEKSTINNSNNFRKPCQIEIFWIEEPSFQFIILSNFPDREDKEIIINGPINSHDFKQQCIQVLKEKRWNRKLPDNNYPKFIEKYDILGKEMARGIHQFIESCTNYLTSPLRNSGDYGGLAIENTWTRTYIGNIADLDYVEEVNKIILGLKEAAQRKKEEKLSTQSKPQSSILTEQFVGFGVHLFPPVIIGEKRERTIEELIYDHFPSQMLKNKVLDTKISNKQVIVNTDGFVFIESKDRTNALKILNLIMAVGFFHNQPFFAVRDHELAEVNYDKSTLMTTGMRWNYESRRAFLFEERWYPKNVSRIEKKEINPTKLKEIFEDVQKLNQFEKLSEDLRIFNESYTHLQNSEFAQSFIMSWTVIERHYSNFWRSMLHDRNLDDDRFSKLANSSVWSIDFILESLSLQGTIKEQNYDLLMELKKKRDKFYHSGKQVTKEDTERCIGYASEILNEKIHPITK